MIGAVFAPLVAMMAGALLVLASESRAQGTVVVNEWVNESMKVRARNAE